LALVYDSAAQTIQGLDATGRSPFLATPEEFASRGLREMPGVGPLTVDVPGSCRRLASTALAIRQRTRSRKPIGPAIFTPTKDSPSRIDGE
jgi:gamma-glutamyltranspeptidase